MHIVIRPAAVKDITAIDKLGTCSYPANFEESAESFTAKITAGESRVAEIDSYVIGYLIAFPYTLGEACVLNTDYVPVKNPDCLYIHDLCISERFRRLGIGTLLAKDILKSKWENYSLVAVLGAAKFWAELGFVAVRDLNYHGAVGVYMELKR
jgi:predicted N-acetyltransferase YhbS